MKKKGKKKKRRRTSWVYSKWVPAPHLLMNFRNRIITGGGLVPVLTPTQQPGSS
jgi:hypothetical protein